MIWPVNCFPQGMMFFPIYRIHRSTGEFTRIGSLLGPRRTPVRATAPALRAEAHRVFAGGPEDVILVGPRLPAGERRRGGSPGPSD